MLRLSLAPSYGFLTRTVTKLTGLGGPDGEWDDVFFWGGGVVTGVAYLDFKYCLGFQSNKASVYLN